MRAARNRRKKSQFVKKVQSFFIYSFISIVVIGFILNTFLSNLLEYSFALANSGGVVDLKTDQKYSIALITTNKLKEVKSFDLITYDKKNKKIYDFNLDSAILIKDGSDEYELGDILQRNDSKNLSKLNEILKDSLATNLAFTYVTSSDNSELISKLLLGKGNLLDLYSAKDLNNLSLRDLYFVYSFAGSVDSKDRKEEKIPSLDRLDMRFKDIYLDSEIGTDSPSITVVNTTSVNGLGKKYTRIIDNLGGRVVDTSNSDEEVVESFIIYKSKTQNLDYLTSKLGIKKSLSMEEVGLKYPEIIKSDLVIVLGIDKGK